MTESERRRFFFLFLFFIYSEYLHLYGRAWHWTAEQPLCFPPIAGYNLDICVFVYACVLVFIYVCVVCSGDLG